MGLCFSCFYINQLQNVDSSVRLFSFDGYKTQGKVVYVYDGDTVHIVIPLKETNQLVKIKTRLNGIDTPEMRVPEQKQQAIKAKSRLNELLQETQYLVNVHCGNFDKYGRVLVDIYSPKYDLSINQILVNEGYAYEYHGKTKRDFIPDK